MDQRVKALWIDALESGEYKQGTGRLRNTNELTGEHNYCCLGVLCDLYSKETGEQWSDLNAMHGSHSFPSRKVLEWAGMTDEQATGRFGDVDVVQMNDSEHDQRSFMEIAEAIHNNA